MIKEFNTDYFLIESDDIKLIKNILYSISLPKLNELQAKNRKRKILAFIKPIKKYKLGNCGESAQLAAIVAKINGIKDCHIAQICNHEAKDLDHSVLFVNDKKPYIIDCWLGFADYAPNALNKYKTLYNKIFKLKDNNQLTFYTNINDEYTDFLKEEDFKNIDQ